MAREVEVPEEAKAALYDARMRYQNVDPREQSEDGWAECLLQAAAPIIRSQERQQVREAASQAIHDLATHIGRARLALMPTLEIDVAQSELKLASDAMKALRSALALDTLEDDGDV